MTDPSEYIKIERKIINLMLHFPEIIQEIVSHNISVDFFDERHKHLVQSILYVFTISDGKRLLTSTHYKNIIIDQGGKGNISIPMDVYQECKFGVAVNNSKEDFDFLFQELISLYVHREGVMSLQRFNTNVPKMGYIGATKQYAEDLTSVVNLTELKKSVFMTIKEKKEEYISNIKSRRDNPGEIIKCGIPEIDTAMSVGFKPGHTTVFVATTGGYKTTVMINVAVQMCKLNNCQVLFAPLEMDWEDLMGRIVSKITGISYSKILNPYLLADSEITIVEESTMWAMENFGIIDVDEQITVSVLRSEIEKRIEYFKPKLLVIDYLALLKSESKFQSRHDLELGELAKSLKFLGKKHGFHIMTAAQLGRADIKRIRDNKDAPLDSTAVKDSQEISANAEFVFGLTNVPDEEDKLKFHVIKSRYGPSGYTKELRVNPDRCQIMSTDPSVNTLSIGCGDMVDDFDAAMNITPEQASNELKEMQEVEFKNSGYTLEDLDMV